MGFGAKRDTGEWTDVWMDRYPLDCYDNSTLNEDAGHHKTFSHIKQKEHIIEPRAHLILPIIQLQTIKGPFYVSTANPLPPRNENLIF